MVKSVSFVENELSWSAQPVLPLHISLPASHLRVYGFKL